MRPLTIEKKGDVVVMRLGDVATLNEGQATGLRQQIYTELSKSESPRVAIDLSLVDYLSSTGIAVLIGTMRRVEAAQGRLVLFSLRQEILDVFGIMKLVNLFEIADDESQAVQLLSSPRPE